MEMLDIFIPAKFNIRSNSNNNLLVISLAELQRRGGIPKLIKLKTWTYFRP